MVALAKQFGQSMPREVFPCSTQDASSGYELGSTRAVVIRFDRQTRLGEVNYPMKPRQHQQAKQKNYNYNDAISSSQNALSLSNLSINPCRDILVIPSERRDKVVA